MGQYIINLFQGMSWLTISLLLAGVLLCAVEVFVPKFGLAGWLGIGLTLIGISSYYIDGFKFIQIVGILVIIALFLAFVILIDVIIKGFKDKKEKEAKERLSFENSDAEFKILMWKYGKAVSRISKGGTVEIGNNLYYAISNEIISEGTMIQVIGVQNNALVVKAV